MITSLPLRHLLTTQANHLLKHILVTQVNHAFPFPNSCLMEYKVSYFFFPNSLHDWISINATPYRICHKGPGTLINIIRITHSKSYTLQLAQEGHIWNMSQNKPTWAMPLFIPYTPKHYATSFRIDWLRSLQNSTMQSLNLNSPMAISSTQVFMFFHNW